VIVSFTFYLGGVLTPKTPKTPPASYGQAFETGARAVRRHDNIALIAGLRAASDAERLTQTTQTDIATT